MLWGDILSQVKNAEDTEQAFKELKRQCSEEMFVFNMALRTMKPQTFSAVECTIREEGGPSTWTEPDQEAKGKRFAYSPFLIARNRSRGRQRKSTHT